MHLKKLELLGFKSFPEKTAFVFTDGITAIVGPNGCGKTNLLDALRWVLGEQKTSLLRGSKMEEVVFSGTRTLKPLGMAEVSLHLENRNGILPSQYGELQITRRLFRSGDSEYLLNKVPCRLRDITDLFADTGLGSHAYAIIQQEMIDAILSDRAEERRFLFEEAAGITKYKQRKVAAERKLEATEQDLLRLQDILNEVTARVSSLKRQVAKARRYQEISDELKGWDLFQAKHRHTQLLENRKDLTVTIKTLRDRRLGIETRLDAVLATMEENHRQMADLDRALSQVSGKILQLSENAHRLETAISVAREKKTSLEKSCGNNGEEIDALGKRAEIIRQDADTCQNEIDHAETDLQTAAGKLEEVLARQKAADEAYLRFRVSTDDESNRLLDLEGRISSGRTDSANIDEQLRELQVEMEQHNQRRQALVEEKLERRKRIGSQQILTERLREEISADEHALADKENELEAVRGETDRCRDQISELSSSHEATLARKSLITEMVEQHEGFGSGVVAIFEAAGRWVDITGTVADFLRPREGYRTAIEATLGESAQYILCRSRTTAREAIAYLKLEKAGRASFLILEGLPERIERPSLPAFPGLIGWADSLVECDERYGRVPAILLGRTAVCETIEAAQQAIEALPAGYDVVTLDGDLFSARGLWSGGASEELSLIGRKDEISALERRLNELEQQINAAKGRQAAATLKIGEHQQALSRLREKLEEDKERLGESISRLKEEQFKISAADEVVTSIDYQISQYSQKLERLKHRQYTLTLDFDQLDREKAAVTGRVQSHKERLEELEKAAHEAAEQVNRQQMQRVELESRRNHLAGQKTHLEELLTDIAANMESRKRQIAEAEETAAQLAGQIASDEIRLKELFDLRQQETAAQQQELQRQAELTEAIGSIEQQARGLRQEKEQLADETHRAEISLTEINSRVEQLEERIRREYGIEIAEVQAPAPDPQLPEDQVSTHVGDLRERLVRMGIVNLLALEEYEEQKQRQEFLSRQLDDLIQAKATLKTTIGKINQTAREMFLETLEKARGNFRQLYEELFSGGEADVFLEDPTNPLESRLEIVSRPRGKRPLTIAQLSGGERALTAISLLFALYMVKPSPFCFLDEIDAPLDDVNIARFLRIVKKFSEQTQFIIITHNKITMEAADTLYGVTMEEPGVSKVVSVRFKKSEDAGDSETLLDHHYARDDNLMQAG